ncbi:hypothetical protein [Limnoglobus roseus]|uniref:Uncharacterized protein n=1 Tax=Limnoglobus roseus TaxID=2598579 RepID=A0A5C1AEY7_9BACT|nr:hypothetical protein [Limnoglobus roseus]QEL16526.1 hypothetical protein PX52LOC_03485 [Limnoglobus roseus]
MYPELPFLAAGGILCFTPLTLYLFWLAAVNRGTKPAVVSGTWDFVALLAGLSGFIFSVGVVLVLLSTSVNVFRRGGFAELQKAVTDAQIAAAITPIAYALLVVLSVLLTLKSRRRSLVVYNVHPPAIDTALIETFEKLNLPAKRNGNLWSNGRGLIEVATFHVFSHVTLKLLPADPRLGEELERELRTAMPVQPIGENPAGPWLTTAAVSCFITTLSCVVLTFVAAYKR